jgi:hypothetical protein
MLEFLGPSGPSYIDSRNLRLLVLPFNMGIDVSPRAPQVSEEKASHNVSTPESCHRSSISTPPKR